ncbi:hypothetical protein CC78DRAFT_576930 [Lojkania enalia]|uniref:Uncharacterized protein n=1 Tax=Lojkania enalia TaxID=147567 RepID=A0A9P4KFA2_9PLEO|nr:hypothetical protein CC78DRAFT_576930 [Didymosphaeria enalia]
MHFVAVLYAMATGTTTLFLPKKEKKEASVNAALFDEYVTSGLGTLDNYCSTVAGIPFGPSTNARRDKTKYQLNLRTSPNGSIKVDDVVEDSNGTAVPADKNTSENWSVLFMISRQKTPSQHKINAWINCAVRLGSNRIVIIPFDQRHR